MALLARATPRRAAHVFALANIAFLGADIGLAHLANAYALRVEWAPIYFSAVATILLVPGAVGVHHRLATVLDLVVGWGAVFVGVAGMLFHLRSGFFAVQTLHNLVYSAPFVAPASYIGVGLLLLLLGSKDADTPAFGRWIVLLALGGFVGNFGLSLLDHAQNGFFHPTEWIPVGSAALAIGFLLVTLATSAAPPLALRRCVTAVMLIQVVVGLSGFLLHVTADLRGTAVSFLDRFVYGAPTFAPLLFADLAALAVIGLWASSAAIRGTLVSPRPQYSP